MKILLDMALFTINTQLILIRNHNLSLQYIIYDVIFAVMLTQELTKVNVQIVKKWT